MNSTFLSRIFTSKCRIEVKFFYFELRKTILKVEFLLIIPLKVEIHLKKVEFLLL